MVQLVLVQSAKCEDVHAAGLLLPENSTRMRIALTAWFNVIIISQS
jgi:hypothetical protein